MIFLPTSVKNMWDTWMFQKDGLWYLYYLITERGLGEGFGVATSPDGVHFTDHGPVLMQGKDALWLGTGSVWEARKAGLPYPYICNFSEWEGKDQIIRFAGSSDLIQWNRLSDEHDFAIDQRWYSATGRKWTWLFRLRSMLLMYLAMGTGLAKRWDSICVVPKEEGTGYWGFWTASPASGPGFAMGESDDGLNWRALPPPDVSWNGSPVPRDLELGAVEHLDTGWFALVGSVGGHGMYVLRADQPYGPYRLQTTNSCVLGSASLRLNTYYCRFVRSNKGVLVHHQAIGRKLTRRLRPVCQLAPLKRAQVGEDGVLRLTWWEGNNCLEGEPIELPAESLTMNDPTGLLSNLCLCHTADLHQGIICSGQVITPDLPHLFRPRCLVSWTVFTRGRGGMVALDLYTDGTVQIRENGRRGYSSGKPHIIDRGLPITELMSFKLLVRQDFLEFYLSDILIQSYSLPRNSRGGISVSVTSTLTRFDGLRLHRMTFDKTRPMA